MFARHKSLNYTMPITVIVKKTPNNACSEKHWAFNSSQDNLLFKKSAYLEFCINTYTFQFIAAKLLTELVNAMERGLRVNFFDIFFDVSAMYPDCKINNDRIEIYIPCFVSEILQRFEFRVQICKSCCVCRKQNWNQIYPVIRWLRYL